MVKNIQELLQNVLCAIAKGKNMKNPTQSIYNYKAGYF
jgi:hypothetical protein